MHPVRNTIQLRGRHLDAPLDLVVTDERARVHLSGDAAADAATMHAALGALDAAWPTLRDDERAVFLIGHEAACALDVSLPRRASQPARFGADARVVVARVVPSAGPPSLTPAPSLHLRVAPQAQTAHLERVRAVRERLLAGDIYQANVAHRVEVAPVAFAAGVAFFAAHTADAPPPFAALVDDAAFGTLVSLSPERFLSFDLGRSLVAAYPIKGTRPRGTNARDDEAQRQALLSSEKDQAEHVMIVDLMRNDLGRVAVAGGVQVDRLLEVVSVKNVHHLESTISARLLPNTVRSTLIAATAPGGSVTGAPKSTAVQAIADLEDGPRGPYTGVLGVVDRHGRGTSSLLIRTWIRPDEGPGSLHVGGGIVVDSVPEQEWQETLQKARAFGEVAVRDER
jgi:anthranilate/para-aminobenzoate synthase component I